MNRSIFEETVVNMVGNEQFLFYGHIMAACKVSLDDKFPAPAGVCFKDGQFHLMIGPAFEAFSLDERKAVLTHESLHIVLDHIGRHKNKNPQVWNMACDIAINPFIQGLPPGCLLPSQFELEEKLSAEIYYSLLREKMEKQEIKIWSKPKEGTGDKPQDGSGKPQDGNGEPQDGEGGEGEKDWFATVKTTKNGKTTEETYKIDPHEQNGDTDDTAQDMVSMIRERLVERAESKSRGLVPAGIAEEIEKLRSKAINWTKRIRGTLSNSTMIVEETIKRRNRRFSDRPEVKGFIKTPTSKGIVIADTSGSVDSKFLSEKFGEITHLCNSTGAEATLIQVDAEVHEAKEFNPKAKRIGVKGRGGTHLYPALEYCRVKKIKYDWVVVLTDGEIERDWPIPPKCKVYFVLPKGGELFLNTSNMKAEIFKI